MPTGQGSGKSSVQRTRMGMGTRDDRRSLKVQRTRAGETPSFSERWKEDWGVGREMGDFKSRKSLNQSETACGE